MTEAGYLAILKPPLQFANQEQIEARQLLEKLHEVRDYLRENSLSTSDISELTCDDCHGGGTVECPHCGQDMDCDTCGGQGDVGLSDEDTELDIEFLDRVLEEAMEIVASRKNEGAAL